MGGFEGRTAVVTGGASGIGRALCRALGREGAVVHVADINADGAKEVSDAIVSTGGRASFHAVDVARQEEVKQLIRDAVTRTGRLDYMFNNAGIAIGGEVRDMDDADWKHIIDVNLWGVIYGTADAYSLMARQGFGHIVNTASLAGLIPVPLETAYCTTKYAVVGLSTALRREAEALGVKVSVVSPGFIKTNIFKATKMLHSDVDRILAKNPFRMMAPDKAARVILKGVAKNKEIIVVTPHAFVLRWLYAYLPFVADALSRKTLKDFRKIRSEYISAGK